MFLFFSSFANIASKHSNFFYRVAVFLLKKVSKNKILHYGAIEFIRTNEKDKEPISNPVSIEYPDHKIFMDFK